MEFGERLVKAREMLGLSQSDLADKIDLAAQSLVRYEKNKVKPSVEFLAKLTNMFNINSNWLLTGKGKILIEEVDNLPIAIASHPEDDENTVALNYFPDIVAAAGYGAVNETGFQAQVMRFDRRFLEQFLNVRRFDSIDIITVFGDSMEPFVHNGETVLIERTTEARNGDTVIANVNGSIYIKRFHADPFGRWVKLISDNSHYDEIPLSGDELQYLTIIGIVRAKIKAF